MVADVLNSMEIPESVLETYVTKLKTYFKNNSQIEENEKSVLNKKLSNVKEKLDRLSNAYLEGDFDRNEYKERKANFEVEKKELEEKLNSFPTSNKQFEISLEYLAKVVSKANELYNSSEIDKKREILHLVFPNFFLDGSKLSYTIRKPFDMYIKKASCLLNWA